MEGHASLASGIRIGPYEIVSLLGRGGMGEVYRATDTNIRRPVALKLLPASFAADASRLARLRREAQLLAALDHPGVARVHGLETSDGLMAIVMELVEGEALDARIARGPLPLPEALRVARQIADALAAAHERGIVHRDLKPANVKLGPDGRVKVLDFGLAKAGDSQPDAVDSQLPTREPGLTRDGVVVGTAPYMSPEQARGEPVDRRTDVWAFGCVLYEMLTARRAFPGSTASDALAAILAREPDWPALPPSAGPLSPVLRRCLEKDRERRLRDIADARLWLDEASAPATAPLARSSPLRSRPRGLWMAGAFVGMALAATAGWLLARASGGAPSPPTMRFELGSVPAGAFGFGAQVAISRDGTRIAYSSLRDGTQQLFLRRLDQLAGVPIAGTEGGGQPFFSPDGRQLGYVTSFELRRVPVDGGPASVVCKVNPGTRGATWGTDDRIVFAQNARGRERDTGMFSVPARGGEPELLFEPDAADEMGYSQPELLPGGRAILYAAVLTDGGSRVMARRLEGGAATVVAEGGFGARYLAPGFVLFADRDRIMAVRFDAETLQVRGEPVPVQDGVFNRVEDGIANVATTSEGTVVYLAGRSVTLRRLIWVDRGGRRLAAAVPTEMEGGRNPRLSPDGRKVAITVGGSLQHHIWIHDLSGAAHPIKLTHRKSSTFATWSADGKRIFMASWTPNGALLSVIPSDGSALDSEPLAPGDISGSPFDASPDGAFLLFRARQGKSNSILPLGGGAPRPWPGTPFMEIGGDSSPDGRLAAYVSDASGKLDIWLSPFPGPGTATRVSADGGVDPVWSRDGRELFYRSGARLLSAKVAVGADGLRVETPRVLFEGGFVRDSSEGIRYYDAAADGRLLMLESVGDATVSVVLVRHWVEELARRIGS